MSERQIITISDDKLSCEATAILLRMLNFPIRTIIPQRSFVRSLRMIL